MLLTYTRAEEGYMLNSPLLASPLLAGVPASRVYWGYSSQKTRVHRGTRALRAERAALPQTTSREPRAEWLGTLTATPSSRRHSG